MRNYCLERREVNYVDVMACFYELKDSQLQRVFEGLEREGLLEVRTCFNLATAFCQFISVPLGTEVCQ